MPNQKQDTPVFDVGKATTRKDKNRALPFHTTYDRAINVETRSKIIESETARYYFADKLLIRLTVGNSEIKSGTQKYTELREELRETATRLKAAFEEN